MHSIAILMCFGTLFSSKCLLKLQFCVNLENFFLCACMIIIMIRIINPTAMSQEGIIHTSVISQSHDDSLLIVIITRSPTRPRSLSP